MLSAAACVVMLLVVVSAVMVAAPCLDFHHLLAPALQCTIVDELHHHEHVSNDKVPAAPSTTHHAHSKIRKQT